MDTKNELYGVISRHKFGITRIKCSNRIITALRALIYAHVEIYYDERWLLELKNKLQ